MKKQALLSLLLALVLFFSGCSLPFFDLGAFTTTQGGSGGPDKPTAPPYDEDATSYGYYYDQLDLNEKAVYRAIYKGARAGADIPFSLYEALSISTPTSEGDAAHAEAITAAVRAVIQPAMDALAYDHPEIAWIAYGGEGGSSFAISTRTGASSDGRKTTEVASLSFVFALKAPLISAADIDAFEGEMSAVVDEILALAASAQTTYERLSILQNELCRRIVYDKSADRAHEAAGALLDGRAVCDGYAKAFKILCDAAGIPSVIVAGTAVQNGASDPHAWNYVQMDDGLWYAVDTTWNDDGDGASSDYFLVGASTLPAFGRAPFALSHLPNGKFSSGEYTPFSFPTLAGGRFMP